MVWPFKLVVNVARLSFISCDPVYYVGSERCFFVNPIHAVLRHRDMITICDGAVIIRPLAKPGSDWIRPESDRIRSDRIGLTKHGPDQ